MSVPKLSEAMILGSVSTTQGFGVGSQSPNSNEPCAIGTALRVVGSKVEIMGAFEELWTIWPWTRGLIVEAPNELYTSKHWMKEDKLVSFTRVVYNLNDNLKWPRPKIAEWIASVEPQEESISTHLLEVEEQVKLLDTKLVSSNEVA